MIAVEDALLVYADSQVIKYEGRTTSRNTCEARLHAALQQEQFVLKMVKMWYFAGQMVLVAGGDTH